MRKIGAHGEGVSDGEVAIRWFGGVSACTGVGGFSIAGMAMMVSPFSAIAVTTSVGVALGVAFSCSGSGVGDRVGEA